MNTVPENLFEVAKDAQKIEQGHKIKPIYKELAKINKLINFPIIRNILGIMDGASRTTWRCKSILTVFSNDAVALEDLR